MSRAAVWLAAMAGVIAGVLLALVITTPDVPVEASRPSATPVRGDDAPEQTPSASPSEDVPEQTPTAEPGPAADPVLLVWTAGGLPADLISAVDADPAVRRHSVVWGGPAGLVGAVDGEGTVVLALDGGWQVPVDLLAVDPHDHAGFAAPGDRQAIERLRPGEALLSATSARLRGVGEGAVLRLETGVELVVAAVVEDVSVAGAEVVVHVDQADAVAAQPRYVLAAYVGDRPLVQDRLSAVVDDRPIRFRSPAETTWLRHGDAVLPQSLIKARFGEFAVRPGPGRSVEQDPEWVRQWIITAQVPVLGEFRCHRDVVGPLSAAMAELAAADLAHLVDPASFAGCWAPRRIAADQPLSRHAWGVAVDLNVGDNPRGSFSTQDARLVETMRTHGFTWGGTWLVPDPAHYEIGR